MSVPDEPSHTIKAAAVVRGELSGTATDSGAQTLQVIVPEWVALSHELTCYAFQNTVTPACSAVQFQNTSQPAVTVTTAGNYNPVYYAIVGVPSLFLEGKLGLYSMRLVSALLSCLFLASMFCALSQLAKNRWASVGAVASVTPMVLFLNGSVNPNSLEFATAGAIFANLLALTESRGRPGVRTIQVAWVTAAGVLLANTKGASLLWLLVAVALPIVLVGWRKFVQIFRNPWALVGAALIGASCAFAIWWILSRDALASKPFEGAGSSFVAGVVVMLQRTFDYTSGLIGYFGWLDTPAPSFVLLAWGCTLVALIVAALALSRGPARAALIVALVAFIALPVLMQASIVTKDGYIWQGRYILALFAILMLAAGVAMDRADVVWNAITARFIRWAIVLLGLAHAYAFLWALRRYVTGLGLGHSWLEMLRNPSWQPPLGWPLWFVVYVSLLVLAARTMWVLLPSNRSTAPLRATGLADAVSS